MRLLAEISEVPCTASSLWDHINGWEVVAAVVVIIAGWAATNIARMYFMVRMAEAKRPEGGSDV